MIIENGLKINKWTVLERAVNRGYRKVWLCLCECGKQKEIYEQNLKNGSSQSCGCYISEKFWKGFEKISLTYWNRLIRNSKSRDIEFNINIEDAWNIYLKQNKVCALSKVEIIFTDSTSGNRVYKTTASLDRIDSSKGYVIDNVQWVHKDINKLKGNMSDTNFISWCKRVALCH